MFERIKQYLNPARREAFYAAVAVLVPLLVNLGFLTEGVGATVLSLLGAVLALLAAVLQIANFTPGLLGRWYLDIGRAAVYAFAGAVVPVLVTLGVTTEADGATLLGGLSTVLTAIAALIGIFAPKLIQGHPVDDEVLAD